MDSPTSNRQVIAPGIWGRELAGGQVHIWQAGLDIPAANFRRLVSPDERERARRFRSGRDGERFIVRRGVLRTLLGFYLNAEPASIRFSYDDHNKPSLAGQSRGDGLHFNISHSEELALFAFCRGGNIGVDVESVRDIRDMEAVAGRILSPEEKADFQVLNKRQQRATFYRYWTRKEALVKATGDGLSRTLHEVTATPSAGDTVLLDGSSWYVYDLKVNRGYRAAFATPEPCREVACFQW